MKSLEDHIKEEEQWIDFLEGELDPSLEEDLRLMLNNDEETAAMVQEYQALRAYVENEDKNEMSASLPTDEKYFVNLHDKIMADVGSKGFENQFYKSWNVKQMSMMAMGFLICILSITSVINVLNEEPATGQEIAKLEFKQLIQGAKVKDLSVISNTVLSHQEDMDLLLETESAALKGMSDNELKALLNEMM
ncbi:MAG: hypothetical protein AB8E15_09780 [Bdellovibrionales bacterium]